MGELALGVGGDRSVARQAMNPSGRTSTAPAAPVPQDVSSPSAVSITSAPTRYASSGTPAETAAAREAAHQLSPPGPASRTKWRPKRSNVDRSTPSTVTGTWGARKPGRPDGSPESSQIASSRPSEHHGGRAVTVAELDGGLPDDRHQVVLAERGIEAKHVTRVGLLGRECADRLALGVIGGEQRLVRSAVQDVRELPREVVPVLHAAVAAEPAPWEA